MVEGHESQKVITYTIISSAYACRASLRRGRQWCAGGCWCTRVSGHLLSYFVLSEAAANGGAAGDLSEMTGLIIDWHLANICNCNRQQRLLRLSFANLFITSNLRVFTVADVPVVIHPLCSRVARTSLDLDIVGQCLVSQAFLHWYWRAYMQLLIASSPEICSMCSTDMAIFRIDVPPWQYWSVCLFVVGFRRHDR